MNKDQEKKLSALLTSVAKEHKVSPYDVVGFRRSADLLSARRKFFVAATQDLGVPVYEVAEFYGWTPPAIYYHVNKWRDAQRSAKPRKKAA